MVESAGTILLDVGLGWEEARRLAGAFLAGLQSPETRRGYRSDLRCWFDFCRTHRLHPFREIRRIHLELYLRQLETSTPRPANATLYRRISALSWVVPLAGGREFNVGKQRCAHAPLHPSSQTAAVAVS
ncbi:MAG: site-specific integrase [Actinomycetota bacterium]|nr:site-specific integrase [Actinomycetota bacterium]